MDVDLWLDDRHQTGMEHRSCDSERLLHDGLDPDRVSQCHHRPHLGAVHAVSEGPLQQGVHVRDGLYQLDAVGLLGQALVDLEERHDLLVLPEELRRTLSLDLTVHRHLEQDRSQDAAPVEGRARDDATTHPMDQVEHLLLVRPAALRDPVQPQRFGRASAALVQRRDEPGGVAHLLEHLVVLLRVHRSSVGRKCWSHHAPGRWDRRACS